MKTLIKAPFPTVFKDDFVTAVDSFFDKVLNERFPEFKELDGINLLGQSSYPKVNITEHNDKFTILAEIPGLNKEDLSIKIKDKVLSIKGSKKQAQEDKGVTYLLRELKHSSFQRSFILSDELDHNSLKAKFDNGLLTVEILRKEPKEIKETEISIE